jgi:uncharacterized membrane protein
MSAALRHWLGKLRASSLDPARVYAWVGGASILLLVILVPPFQVPDEPQHFYRSYQLSTGELWPKLENGAAGSDLPASLPALVERFLGTTELHTERGLRTAQLQETLAEFSRPLDVDRTAFVDFSGSAFYAPLPYLPQALAIAGARAVGIGPLGLFYVGRLANALAAIIATYIAIRLLPVGRGVALVVALLPMTQFQTASLSADGPTIAAAFLFTAIITRFLVDGVWAVGRTVAAFASGLIMCSVKFVYMPLLFAGLGTLFGSSAPSRKAWGGVVTQVGTALAVTALVALWLHANTGRVSGLPEGVDMEKQVALVLERPELFLATSVRSLLANGEFLARSLIGILGWLSLALPAWVYATVGFAIAFSVYSDVGHGELPWPVAVWLLTLATGAFLLVQLALYVYWNPVGARIIEGVQGRYIIPLLPMVGVAVSSVFPRRQAVAYRDLTYPALAAIMGVASVGMHVTIVRGFGVF